MNYQELSNEELLDECRHASNGDWMSGLKAELRRRLEAAESRVITSDYGDGPCWNADH